MKGKVYWFRGLYYWDFGWYTNKSKVTKLKILCILWEKVKFSKYGSTLIHWYFYILPIFFNKKDSMLYICVIKTYIFQQIILFKIVSSNLRHDENQRHSIRYWGSVNSRSFRFIMSLFDCRSKETDCSSFTWWTKACHLLQTRRLNWPRLFY